MTATASTDISAKDQVATTRRNDLVDFIHKQLQFQHPCYGHKEFLDMSFV